MDWTVFLSGVLVGWVAMDLLWRVTYRLDRELVEAQRDYIAVLEAKLEEE